MENNNFPTVQIDRDRFQLNKFKILDGSVIINYEITGTIDNNDDKEFKKLKVHQDLEDALFDLREIMAMRVGLVRSLDILLAEKPAAKLKKRLDELRQEEIDRCKPSGISIGEFNNSYFWVITGQVKLPTYGQNSLGLSRIVESMDNLGYEKELSKKVDVIIDEVYKLLTEGKRTLTADERQTKID